MDDNIKSDDFDCDKGSSYFYNETSRRDRYSDPDSKRVLVWGTFDALHNGHKEFLKKARNYGRLYVIIVPSFMKQINKGYLPKKDEYQRRKELLYFGKVENDNLIENVYIDCFTYGMKSIFLIQPDIVIFGYDQKSIYDKLLLSLLKYYEINVSTINFPGANGDGSHSSNIYDYTPKLTPVHLINSQMI